jgi:hypothetical protein
VTAVTERRTFIIVLACLVAFAVAGAAFGAAGAERYRARAFVIQVPAALAGDPAIRLARSDRVLRQALMLSGVGDLSVAELRRGSRAEITSRLDVAFTVEAARADTAVRLATGYARAFRQAIPDDRGLPTRGVGARRAEGELGPLGWGLIGAMAGLGVGVALALVLDGLSRGSGRAPRRSSRPDARARRATRG